MTNHPAHTPSARILSEPLPGLDAQYAALLEAVFTCERDARREDRLDAQLRLASTVYGTDRR
jgi:hypothetical protein